MNNDALSNLKPLIAPAPVSWWPPAPGWWLLAALLLLAILALTIYGWRRWRYHCNTAYQREAIQLIDLIDTFPSHQQLQLLAEILRRAAVCAWGRERVGSESWPNVILFSHTDYLQRSRKKNAPATLDENSGELLSNNLYSGVPPSDKALQTIMLQGKAWLETLPPVER